ncbi:cysteine protease ATG4A isoform X2 [Aethina tumida]|uniref:cysteine protease ATG4A isoform X2 n=1 Tax=Aethina tumida TaxID=116153 RepID=UPI00096B4C06|nr:cysteine protease ATG4A isoform X2 [Aethina tumida]
MCIATRDIMDGMFEAYLDASSDPDDIPKTNQTVWILGREYHASDDLKMIRQDISSKLWFTYRRGFVPIGGDNGPTTDKGWGCMLRCGQMVLGQAIVLNELGRDWVWDPDTKDQTYLKILKKFEDSKKAPYSIHQIALMGESEGKKVGEWFGPNTVAQVLKKLIKYDDSNLRIHVALDSAVIISDINASDTSIKSPETTSITTKLKSVWVPLLLIVPLRLGLNEINPIYLPSLKKCLQFEQSAGIIGGKPDHALYFIGYVGDEAIYLDPHTTHLTAFIGKKENKEQIHLDSTYHIKYASRMNMAQMDPSIAVCFFCKTEVEFFELCKRIKEDLIDNENTPLFELSYDKPKEWIPEEEEESVSELVRNFDSDHEFEIL